MIDARGLRIGNWIKDGGGKQWQIDHWESKDKVSAKEPDFILSSMNLVASCHPMTDYVNYLQPIPLTEEWLIRFGFEKREGFIDDNLDFNIGLFIIQNHLECNNFISLNTNPFISIKHVHQLQNLYKALTNEELELK